MGLEIVELFIAFEEKFDVAIPNDIAPTLTTPREVTDFIMTRVTDKRLTRKLVAGIVRHIIEENTANHDFTEDSHFVYDMHLD